MNNFIICFLGIFISTVGIAQERSAGSSLDTQVTWSTLSAKIVAANIKSDAAHIRIDKIASCGALGKLYAPDANATNGGCKDIPSSESLSGATMSFAMSTCPTGWLNADGTAVSRSTYASLFTAIGTTYGVGNGSTTFNVPDLRGEFVRGWDNGRGVDSGRTFGSAQAMEAQMYRAGTVGAATEWNPSYAQGVYVGGPYNGINNGFHADPSYNKWLRRFEHVWDRTRETRPRNIALRYCIKQ